MKTQIHRRRALTTYVAGFSVNNKNPDSPNRTRIYEVNAKNEVKECLVKPYDSNSDEMMLNKIVEDVVLPIDEPPTLL